MTYLPLSYLLGSRAKIDIVRILASKHNYTGRKIAILSSTNPNSNKKALDFMVETGLVSKEQVGNSYHYNLNEKHLLYEPIMALFKEEERTINKISRLGSAFIEEFAPKALAGLISYRKSSIEITVIAHAFPIDDFAAFIYEKTGFRVVAKAVDPISLDAKSLANYADRVYFWNNYKTISKVFESKNIVKNFFNF